jgi:predicted dienelactone hydrolase
MKQDIILTVLAVLILLLPACSPATVPTPDAPATTAAATATAAAQAAQEATLFPLAEPGPYPVGWRTYTFQDASRENRRVRITIWYPAGAGAEAGGSPVENAEPDFSAAPYPLLLSSTKVARIFAPYLVSRGFTWASVNLIDTYMEMEEQMYEQPLDILFALEMAASNPEGLEGMIDSDHAGAIGYSFDGYNALAMSGARIDPGFYLSQCKNPEAKKPFSSFSCKPARDWDTFMAGAGEPLTTSEDGLWQPLTDERIRAVMPMACEGWWLFGEKGLAAVDRPILFLDGTVDELYLENAKIFEAVGSQEKGLVSFIGKGHMMIYETQYIARMAHFAAAFFGVYLQGQEDLAQYFSEDFVDRHIDIHWGVYRGVHIPKE